MIRIDEIYNNTFWPWIKKNLPLTRMFFCDPPGDSKVESLINFGSDVSELHYIFMHDQEPVDIDLHGSLFDSVVERNLDIIGAPGMHKTAIVTSERNSDNLDKVLAHYAWKPFYFFFHGWASLDWYRGYNRTFLMRPFRERNITHSFLLPNRIIGGKRDHRLLLLYHLAQKKVNSALISCPRVCPYENQPVQDIAKKFVDRYPDIIDVIQRLNLPWHFDGETDHPMTSCWLDLFDESSTCLSYVVTETVYFGRRQHLTEKTFKPICLGMPFVLVSTCGSLKYLREYGFKTFGDYWDESYDDEPDDFIRLQKIADLLISLDRMSHENKQNLYQRMLPVIEHNYHHFYHGGFESVLWDEFQDLLENLKHYFWQES